MNNKITLQHTEIKASFETSTHVVEHIFKVTLYKRLIDMVSRYALNQITAEFEQVNYVGIDTIHMFWRRLSFSNKGLSEPKVYITEEMEVISKRFEDLDICGKVTLKSKLREIAYPDQNSMCAPPKKVKTKCAQKK